MTVASESGRQQRLYVRPPRVVVFPIEAEVPESKRHLEIRTALYAILKHAFSDRAMIGSDQFVYWDPTDPTECLAPDAFVRLGAPDENFDSWKTWERGAPHVAVEIVSASDASEAAWAPKLHKYRRLGVTEVVRFDPEHGELRIWNRTEGDLVERALGPDEPSECLPLRLFWIVVKDDAGAILLRLARDAAGTYLLPTPEEEARRQRDAALEGRDAALEDRDAALESRDAALERMRFLEAELAKRSG